MLYLDYSANTPVDEAVLQCFCDCLLYTSDAADD